MKTFAVYNLKGGVGKTTTVVNFAYFTAQEGKRTLLWDLDAQGAATFHFRLAADGKLPFQDGSEEKGIERLIKPTEHKNLDVIPANFKIRYLDVVLKDLKKGVRILANLVHKLARQYDYLFFDCPATLSLLAQSVFQSADYLVIPVIPTTLSLQTFKRLQGYYARHFSHKPQLIPFFAMVDQRKSLHRDIMIQASMAGLFCKTFIPTRSIIEQMGRYRSPLASFSPASVATAEYKALWAEITLRLPHG
jgi:chromosome partitioning protein